MTAAYQIPGHIRSTKDVKHEVENLPEGGVGADLVRVGGVVLRLEGCQGAPRLLGGRRGVEVGAGELRVTGVVVLAAALVV